jgi:TonB family protein
VKHLPWIAAAGLVALHLGAAASDLPYVSEPMLVATQRVSTAADPRAYRIDAARHIYASYAPRIYKGRLPPLIHAVVVVESTVDEGGRVRDVKVVRGPSHAPDVTAAVMEMIRRAGPMPSHNRLAGNVKFTEIWLVHKDGRFQLDALTEGQD